ncbi:hypothetical protein ARMSODRAFT_974106 [Armillaria solidipes]|uniref:Uncharacterized protein n=1 Tax=Armillaria solidipes TaxID=1076256 RepID=A0A2H3BIY5_9AGAR|nr:hypothetical protein ARMSODRAFT_974106 [Armillaria solidipes]
MTQRRSSCVTKLWASSMRKLGLGISNSSSLQIPRINTISVETEFTLPELPSPLISLSSALSEATASVSVGTSTADIPSAAIIAASQQLSVFGQPILVLPPSLPSPILSPPPSMPQNPPVHPQASDAEWTRHINQIAQGSLFLISVLATAKTGSLASISLDIDVDRLSQQLFEMSESISFVEENIAEPLQGHRGNDWDSSSLCRSSSALTVEWV